jgi:hypothetical protein
VKVVWFFIALSGSKRYREIVPQCIHQYDYRLVEALGMPAPFYNRSWSMPIPKLDRWNGAFGSILKNESGEEEAAAEEVD